MMLPTDDLLVGGQLLLIFWPAVAACILAALVIVCGLLSLSDAVIDALWAWRDWRKNHNAT